MKRVVHIAVLAALLMAGIVPALQAGVTEILTDRVGLKDGPVLFYRASGAGSLPVVLIHGYSVSSESWERIMALLPDRCRAYALDLRGFGRSDKPAGGYDFGTLADDVASFMDNLGITRAVVAGHSMGGSVVQHLMVRHPERVAAAVLVSTFARHLPSPGMSDSVRARIDAYGTPEENRKVLAAGMPLYFAPGNMTPADLERFVSVGLQAGNDALRQALETNYTAPAIAAERLAALRIPTLVVVSTHDPFGPFDHAAALTDVLPDSEILVIPRSGHSSIWERPEAVVMGIDAFLRSHGL